MGRLRRPPRCLTAPSKPPVCDNAGAIVKPTDVNEATFLLNGVSPIYGNTQFDLLRQQREMGGHCVPQTTLITTKSADLLGLRIAKQRSPRFVSPWGTLLTDDALSEQSLLSFESFERHRFPLHLNGALQSNHDIFKRMRQLMTDAPSEFPSLYWGRHAEFAASGVHVLPGAHSEAFVDGKGASFVLYNAGQTVNPKFFLPNRCVAYVPLLVPEMKYSYMSLSYFWDAMHRQNRTKVYDEWFSMSFIESCGLRLNDNARVVDGRCNMWDLQNLQEAIRAKNNVRYLQRTTPLKRIRD